MKIIIITLSLLLASVPAVGADTAADVPLSEVRHFDEVRHFLCMSRSFVVAADERVSDGPIGDALRTGESYSELSEMRRALRDRACATARPEGATDLVYPCDPLAGRVAERYSRDWSRSECCRDAMIDLSLFPVMLLYAQNLDFLARSDKLNHTESMASMESANDYSRAHDYAQKAVTRACPAEDSLANVPGVSDLCKGLRLQRAATDTLAAIDPDGFPEYSAFASKVNVETTCGDGWLYLTSTEQLCQKAREGLARVEKLLAARERLLALGGLSNIPPSIAADFARAGRHFRKAVDQLCE